MIALLAAGLLAAAGPDGRALIWSDEFEGDTLDPSRWTVVEDCGGGGNEERQCYTAPAVSLRDGQLVLTATHAVTTATMRSYASGKVHTRGLASFRYGRIEVRARMPQGQGLWPAIWMLPEHDNYGPYPQSGEIDIAEAVNLGVGCAGCRDRFYGARHHGPAPDQNSEESGSIEIKTSAAFHLFALDWTPEQMIWLVDDVAYLRADGAPPWDQRFHLILNLAVGGIWAETSGARGVDDDHFPAELLVDYVRVYEDCAGSRSSC